MSTSLCCSPPSGARAAAAETCALSRAARDEHLDRPVHLTGLNRRQPGRRRRQLRVQHGAVEAERGAVAGAVEPPVGLVEAQPAELVGADAGAGGDLARAAADKP